MRHLGTASAMLANGLLVSACGGVATTGNGGGGAAVSTFDERAAAAAALQFLADGLTEDQPNALPNAVAAVDESYARGMFETKCNTDDCRANIVVPPEFPLAGIDLIADVSVSVDFGAQSFGGSITNLQNENERTLAGAIPISETGVNMSDNDDPAFDNISASGSIDLSGETFNLAIGLEGNFYGGTPTALSSQAYGGISGGMTFGTADEELGEVADFVGSSSPVVVERQ